MLVLVGVAAVLRRRKATVCALLIASVAGCGTGENMTPGEDCLRCHSDFTAAGTVFGDVVAPANGGRRGAIVRLTDSTGLIEELITTEVGNFYTDKHLTFPVRVEVQLGTTVRHMEPSAETGACSSCHVLPSANGAAGRVHVSAGR